MDSEINTQVKHATWNKWMCLVKALWQMILFFTPVDKVSKKIKLKLTLLWFTGEWKAC